MGWWVLLEVVSKKVNQRLQSKNVEQHGVLTAQKTRAQTNNTQSDTKDDVIHENIELNKSVSRSDATATAEPVPTSTIVF